MKRFLFVLCIFSTLSAIAQTRAKSYTFDVSNASWLSRYGITTESDVGASALITSKVFKSDDDAVSISFDRGTGLDIRVIRESSSGTHYLTVPRGASLKVSGNGVNIKGFKIPGTDGQITSLQLVSTNTNPMVGSFALNDTQTWYEWNSGSNEISALEFQYQSATVCSIHKIVVDYEAPRDVLSPVSSDMANSLTINSFKNIAFTFANNMSVTNDAQYTLTDGKGNDYASTLSAAANGKVITLSTSSPITEEGTYTLTVKAGSWADADDYRNETLVYTFNVVKNFAITGVSNPSPGVVTSIPSGILLTFEGAVGTVDNSMDVRITDSNGTLIRSAKAAANGTSTVQLTFSNTSPINENGIFTLTIPEKLVYDAAGTHYNAEQTFTFNIGDLASDELKSRAQALLAITGLGYPTADNAERTKLSALPSTASTADYETAIANYLRSTNVEMPLNGNYYYLKAVAKGGAVGYIKYDGTVSITSNSTEATPMKLEGSSGTYGFVMPDGKFLLQLGSAAVASTTASTLTISKLSVAGTTDEETFGLFSLYGSFDGSNAYALVNMNGSFATNAGLGLVNFTSTLTNGFALEVVPDANIPVNDVAYTLNPASGTSTNQLSTVTIAFPNIPAVNLNSKELIKLIKSDNTQTSPASVLPGSKANEYILTFIDVKAGSYTLNIGKGAFSYDYTLPNSNVISAAVQAITATYTVTEGDDFKYDFINKNSVYYKEAVGADQPVKDTFLNDMTFYCDTTIICPNPQMEVTIVNYNTSAVITTGKFVQKDPKTVDGAKSVIKLELANKIEEGSLPAATYAYIIQAGTFGDKNYGDYLSNASSFLASGKSKADCHVNGYLYYIVTVDNARATGEQSEDPDKPIPTGTPSEAMLTKVKSYLDMSGVGYPKISASARTTLANMYQTKSGSDDVFQALLTTYLSSSDIEMPATNSYYTIAATSANGTKAYLHYAEGIISVTKDASKASAFKATTSNGKTAFATVDGKYLGVITPSDNLYASFNGTVNNLTLAQLPVGNDLQEKSFGLLSIVGIKNDATLMSKVNVNNAEIVTNDNQFVFTNDLTSGFKLTETDPDNIPTPTPTYTVSPEGEVTSLNTITVTISGVNDVEATADKSKISLNSGNNKTPVTSVTKLSDGKFSLVFPEMEAGQYTLVIEKGAFTFKFLDRTVDVQEIKTQYSVKQYPSAEILSTAKEKLALTGLGYPSATSKGRTELKALVDKELGSDAKFQVAINAYLAETDIEKPVSNKYYRLRAVTRTDGASYQAIYLTLENGNLSFSASNNQAATFKATANADGTTTFETLDGKYLCLPANDGNFTSTYDGAKNNLTISRLAASSNEFTELNNTFGRMSLSVGGKYAAVNVSTAKILAPVSEVVFGTAETSAFLIEEVDPSQVGMPDVDYTLTPSAGSSVDALKKITITFNTNNEVTLKDQELITLKGLHTSSGTHTPKSVTKVSNNIFDIEFINLAADNYDLIVDKGAFVAKFMDSEASIQRITASYTINLSAEIVADYNNLHKVEWLEEPEQGTSVEDVALNNFTLVSNAPLFVDSSKDVVILNSFGNEKAHGHLELFDAKATRAEAATDAQYRAKLVLDKGIKEGDLTNGTYTIVIEEATFGDENFGKYLVDKNSVDWTNCHVNAKMEYVVNVAKQPKEVNLKPTFDPSLTYVETLEKITLTFQTNDKVSLKDATLIKLINSSKEEFAPQSVTPVEGQTNTFDIEFINLSADSYKLTIDKGAFIVNTTGKDIDIASMTTDYVVSEGAALVTDYDKKYEVEWLEQVDDNTYVKDTDLNTFTLVSKVPFFIASGKDVVIQNSRSEEIARGQLVVMDDAPNTVKLVLNNEIKAATISADTYSIVISEATFGDKNFGAYLEDPMSVKWSDCHVNAKMVYKVKVDNTLVSILGIKVDKSGSDVYDLYGRKIDLLKPGQIYIRDGKKFVIKK